MHYFEVYDKFLPFSYSMHWHMRGAYKLQTKKNLYSSYHTPYFTRNNPTSRIPSTPRIFLATSAPRLLILLNSFPYKYFKYHSCHMPVKILGKLLGFSLSTGSVIANLDILGLQWHLHRSRVVLPVMVA